MNPHLALLIVITVIGTIVAMSFYISPSIGLVGFAVILFIGGVANIAEMRASIRNGFTSKPRFGEGIYRDDNPKGFNVKLTGLLIGAVVAIVASLLLLVLALTQ